MVMAIVIEYTQDFRVISLGPKPFRIQQVRRAPAHVDYDTAIVRRPIVCSGIGTQIASGPRLFVVSLTTLGDQDICLHEIESCCLPPKPGIAFLSASRGIIGKIDGIFWSILALRELIMLSNPRQSLKTASSYSTVFPTTDKTNYAPV